MKKKWVFFLLLFLIWLPTGIDLLFWKKLPAKLPMHFNSQMIADSWGSKAMAVFTLPAILTAAQVLIMLLIIHDTKRNLTKDWTGYIVLAVMPVTSIFLNFIILSTAFADNTHFQQQTAISWLAGIVLIILGISLNYVRQNRVIGIRLPWTLNSQDNWRLTNRLGAKIFIGGGIIELVATIFTNKFLLIPILSVVILILVIYSYALNRKGI